MEQTSMKENVILVDAAYLDAVAADLRLNFGRMQGRQIPPADVADWLVCAALDSSFPQDADASVQVVFLHPAGMTQMQNTTPCHLLHDLDGKAFRDPHMGEFLMSAVRDENVMDDTPLVQQCAETVLDDKAVQRLCLVASDDAVQRMGSLLERVPQGKSLTVLSMQPVDSPRFRHVMLGFSLMHAMGVNL